MTTAKLLWGMTWRGGAWGSLVGAILGAAFGAIFASTLFDLGLVEQSGTMPPSDYPPAIAGFMAGFLALLGGIVGGGVGMPIGWIVGASNGLLIGILLRVSPAPMGKTQMTHGTIFIVSILYTSIASWIGFVAILKLYTARNTPTGLLLMAIAIVPALIAGIAVAFISRLITR